MVLMETRSQWGVSYIPRYFVNGVRVAKAAFESAFAKAGCTPENGEPMENTSYGFRKVWKVQG